ncbi:MAG TPA: glucose-6-phosphate dehydrogenase assembly protein OpcA [Polyangia bacterium]|nr:glucose-6-phosphate dehydrogenase assembly protein OpcA [Polyangia bacterium]
MSNLGEKVERFTGGQEIGVDVSALERELAALWRQAGEREHAVVRACLWNLIFRADGDEVFTRAKALIDAIAPACPARVLVLRADAPGGGPELEAWISANCHVAPGGGKLLCSEELTLQSRGRGQERLPSLVRSLLVPDVPTALIWAGAPPRDAARVEPLLEGVDRMIIDTGDLASDLELTNLAQLARIAAEVELADLGWLRLGPVRLLLASFFDPPVGAEPLLKARRVHLDCAHHGAATAVLLLGWLANALDWGRPEPLKGGAARTWRVPRPDGQVLLEVGVRDVDAGRDGIYELLIESEGGGRFSITDAGPHALELRGTGLPTRVLAAPERPDAELLVAALGVRGRDPLFCHALACAAELEEQGQP